MNESLPKKLELFLMEEKVDKIMCSKDGWTYTIQRDISPALQPPTPVPKQVEDACYALYHRALGHMFCPSLPDKFPEPQDLEKPPTSESFDKKWSRNLPPHLRQTALVRVLCSELDYSSQYAEILQATIRARPAKRQSCKCKPSEFCACVRSYFLRCPGPRELQLKLKNCNRDAYEQMKSYIRHGVQKDNSLTRDGCLIKELEDSPHFEAFNLATNRFLEDICFYIQKMNAVSLVTSPSSWIEQLLLSKNVLTAETVLRQSEDYARYHPNLERIASEVKALEEKNYTTHDIYKRLLPLFRELTPKRGNKPLNVARVLK